MMMIKTRHTHTLGFLSGSFIFFWSYSILDWYQKWTCGNCSGSTFYRFPVTKPTASKQLRINDDGIYCAEFYNKVSTGVHLSTLPCAVYLLSVLSD